MNQEMTRDAMLARYLDRDGMSEGVELGDGTVIAVTAGQDGTRGGTVIRPEHERDEPCRCALTGTPIRHTMSRHALHRWCRAYVRAGHPGRWLQGGWLGQAQRRSIAFRWLVTQILTTDQARRAGMDPVAFALAAEPADVSWPWEERRAWIVSDRIRSIAPEVGAGTGWIVGVGRRNAPMRWSRTPEVERIAREGPGDLADYHGCASLCTAAGLAAMGEEPWPGEREIRRWRERWSVVLGRTLGRARRRMWLRHPFDRYRGGPWAPDLWYQGEAGQHRGMIDLGGHVAKLIVVDTECAIANPELSIGQHLLVWESEAEGERIAARTTAAWWRENAEELAWA